MPAHAPTPTDGHPLIEFLCDPALFGRIPEPERAARFVPEWYRRLNREMGASYASGLPAMTAKACMPLADVFSLGYVIPLPFDVEFRVPAGSGMITTHSSPGLPMRPVEMHDPAQIGAPHPPFEGALPLKFVNPWRIKVPQGYSVLFAHPFSHAELPFTCFSAVVDCDRLATTINFPFVWTGPPGVHHLKAGTPIAQLVPLRRDAAIDHHVSRASTASELDEQAEATRRKYGEPAVYAREWRVKK
jgi:hypothetical protein